MILKVNIYRPKISLMLILLNENKQVIKRHDPIVLKTKAKPTPLCVNGKNKPVLKGFPFRN